MMCETNQQIQVLSLSQLSVCVCQTSIAALKQIFVEILEQSRSRNRITSVRLIALAKFTCPTVEFRL